MWYFPNIMGSVVSFIGKLPRAWISFHKPMASSLANLDGCNERIKQLRRESEDNMTPSIFHIALHPKPEKGHPVLSQYDMGADAFVMFSAGTDTTAHAFVTGTWNLMKNPDMLHKLQQSLKDAIPNPELMNLDWSALEKIDYLVSKPL
jgi:cytochrome P450